LYAHRRGGAERARSNGETTIVKMHALSGGRLRMRKNIYLPDAAREETIELPVPSFLIRHPHGNVLFDTGCHPSVAEHADERWGGMAKFMRPIFAAEDNLLTALHQLGFQPTDIDVVISSHFHPDHCGCNAWNADLLRKSCAEIRRIEANGATLICGHDAAQWASLKKGADAYE